MKLYLLELSFQVQVGHIKLYDLSFFNFDNAIPATYFAVADLNIIKVNKNFRSLFNNDVTLEGQNLLTLLGLLDVAQSYISEF